MRTALLLALAIMFSSAPAGAQTQLTAVWDPSPDPTVTGYVVALDGTVIGMTTGLTWGPFPATAPTHTVCVASSNGTLIGVANCATWGTPSGGSMSAYGTTIPPASSIVDASGHVWTRDVSGAILIDGASAAGGFGDQILWWSDNRIYVKGGDQWFFWNGSGWGMLNGGVDPRGTAPVNQTPSVSLVAPAATTLTAPAAMAIGALASDPDGSVARVEFAVNGVLFGTDTAAPYEAMWSQSIPGAYTFTATAIDTLGASVTAQPFTITVVAPPLNECDAFGYGNGKDDDGDGVIDEGCAAPPDVQPPTISSFVVGRRTGNNYPVTLAITDNVAVEHLELWVNGFMQVRLVAPTTVSSNTWATKVMIKSPGVHVVEARAFDAAGNQATATITVRR
jgi:hypothetical protein